MKVKSLRFLIALLALSIILGAFASCGEEPLLSETTAESTSCTESESEAETKSEADGDSDGESEISSEGEPNASSEIDASEETASESESESGSETESDSSHDTSSESESEEKSETLSEVETEQTEETEKKDEASSESTSEAESEKKEDPETTSESEEAKVTETTIEAEPETTSETVTTAEPETTSETVTTAEPETTSETVTTAEPECEHNNLTAWYYYDDGDANTIEALEARDCTDCEETKVETRKAAFKGWFMSVSGEGEAKGFATSMNIDLAGKAIAPKANSGALSVQLWLALGNGGFDNVYYKVTTTTGESEWLLLASRGNGVANADSGTQASLTNSGYDGAHMGVVKSTVSFKDYSEQTVSVAFAVVPNGAAEYTDKYVIFASFKNVVVPWVDTRPTLEDIAFGSSIKINGSSAYTPSTKNGAKTLAGVTVDDSCQINLNGWCAVDGGVYKYVWSVDGGQNWNEDFVNSERIKTTTTEAIVTTGQAYSGKTFTDIAGAYTNAQFQNGGINIDLSNYANETVDVIFAAIPVVNQDVKIVICTLEDVVCRVE